MHYLHYALVALVAAMMQFYYCFKVVQQRPRRTRRRWGKDQSGYAPNLSPSDNLADPADVNFD